MFTFDQSEPSRIEAPITLAGGTFTLFLKPPSYEDRIVDDALSYERFKSTGKDRTDAFKSQFGGRLKFVTGWDGINDPSGKPVTFSQQGLASLLSKVPEAIEQVTEAIAGLFTVGEPVASPSDSPSNSITTSVVN